MREKTRGFLCSALIFITCLLSFQAQSIVQLPARHSVAVGEPLKLNFSTLFEKTLKAQILENKDILKFDEECGPANIRPETCPVAFKPGQFQMRLSLFGLIPVRDVVTSVVPQVMVVPGGQSIGVLLQSHGVIVAGYSAVFDESGNEVNPAADAGLKEGDVIMTVDGEIVRSEGQIRDLVDRAGLAGQPLIMEVKRKEEQFTAKINPLYCRKSSRYRVGLMVRDSVAGVGTLTFYEPQSMVYGALGHLITDIETHKPVELSSGKITGASVQGIQRGRRGQPGEKIGMFLEDQQLNGTITSNTKLGIFGRLEKPIKNTVSGVPLPVATVDQIHEGQAELLTVLNDNQVERFEIEITKINLQAKKDGKGLVIKVTDQRLLEQAGGIIQGMSGSPIIQDGRLVGAVTHVFVNDPAKGYGVPAEWMLWEADMLPEKVDTLKEQKVAS